MRSPQPAVTCSGRCLPQKMTLRCSHSSADQLASSGMSLSEAVVKMAVGHSACTLDSHWTRLSAAFLIYLMQVRSAVDCCGHTAGFTCDTACGPWD